MMWTWIFDQASASDINDEISLPNVPDGEEEATIERILNDRGGIEFDVIRNPESGELVYLEAKSGRISTSKIREQLVVLKAYEQLNSDVTDTTLTVLSKRGRDGDRIPRNMINILENNDRANFIGYPD